MATITETVWAFGESRQLKIDTRYISANKKDQKLDSIQYGARGDSKIWGITLHCTGGNNRTLSSLNYWNEKGKEAHKLKDAYEITLEKWRKNGKKGKRPKEPKYPLISAAYVLERRNNENLPRNHRRVVDALRHGGRRTKLL